MRRRPARQDPDDDLTWVAAEPAGGPVHLLSASVSLLEGLFGGYVDEPDAAVRGLLRLAVRWAGRKEVVNPLDGQPAILLSTGPAGTLAAEVQGVLEAHGGRAVPDEVVARATMGVEFVASVESESPGSIAAFAGP